MECLVNGTESEPDAITGSDGDASNGFRGVRWVGKDFESAYDGSEDENGFLSGECGADADAGACAEGDEGFSRGLLTFVGFEAVGVKSVGVLPKGSVAVKEPR